MERDGDGGGTESGGWRALGWVESRENERRESTAWWEVRCFYIRSALGGVADVSFLLSNHLVQLPDVPIHHIALVLRQHSTPIIYSLIMVDQA